MSERHERGLDTLSKMAGPQETAPMEAVKQFFPDFYNTLIEFGFSDIYSRPGLDLKQRELLTISSLITQGADSQLPFHLHAALNVGLTPEEILEAVLHCAAYAGFPRACAALMVVMQVFQERNVSIG